MGVRVTSPPVREHRAPALHPAESGSIACWHSSSLHTPSTTALTRAPCSATELLDSHCLDRDSTASAAPPLH